MDLPRRQCWHGVKMLLLLGIGGPAVAQDEPPDDTTAVVALSELGAQMRLNQGRIIRLTLEGDQIDDEAMQLLSGLDRLQSLTLRDTNVTGRGLRHLRGLPLLGALTIEDTPLSDRDIDELAAIKSVVNYNLHGTMISGMGKQRLDRKLRDAGREATVRLHFGGFLGVSGSYNSNRCVLTSVIADSAASDAGLQVGDVIVEFAGQKIEDFSDLAEAVALTPPEQPVGITIERGAKTMELTLSLGRLGER